MKKTIEEEFEKAQLTLSSLELKLRAADKVMKAIDEAVDRGKLDARSTIADARLDYGEPFEYPFLKEED